MDTQRGQLLSHLTIEISSRSDINLQFAQRCWASGTFRDLAQIGKCLSGSLKIETKTIPADGTFPGPAIGCWRPPTHHNAPISLWVCLNVSKRDKFSLVGGFLLTPNRTHGGQVLLGPRATIRKWYAERAKFWFKIADSHSKEQSPTREHIEAGQFLRQDKRIALWQDDDTCPKKNATGMRSEEGKGDNRIQDGVFWSQGGWWRLRIREHDVFPCPQRVEASSFGKLSNAQRCLWIAAGMRVQR